MAWPVHSSPPDSSKKHIVWLASLVMSSFLLGVNYWLLLLSKESLRIPVQPMASQILVAEVALCVLQVYHARFLLLQESRAKPRLSYQDRIGVISRASAECFAIMCLAGIFNMMIYVEIGKPFTLAQATGLEMDITAFFLVASLTLTLGRVVGFYRLSRATQRHAARRQGTPSE